MTASGTFRPTAKDANETMRIMIADDEPSIRFVLQEALEALGHSVTPVEDGDAAARELASGSYDLAFVYIRMPGLTGLEVLQQHRAARGDAAIVIGHSDDYSVVAGSHIGVCVRDRACC